MLNPVNNNRLRASAPADSSFYHWLYEDELLDEALCDLFAAWLDPELTMFSARFANLAASRTPTMPQS